MHALKNAPLKQREREKRGKNNTVIKKKHFLFSFLLQQLLRSYFKINE
jgi:hypothetical protein